MADPAVAVIFVDLTGTEPSFYIAPTECGREDVKVHLANWLRIGRDSPKGSHWRELDRICSGTPALGVLAAGV